MFTALERTAFTKNNVVGLTDPTATQSQQPELSFHKISNQKELITI